MQTRAPSLLPILRSRTLANLLAYLYIHEPMTTLTALANAIGAAVSTVKREIDQLEAAGLVRTVRIGRNRAVAVDTHSPYYPELRALLLKAFGPAAVLRDSLRDIEPVDAAYIFGSWAARHHGERGPLPRDVDLLVVGDADPDDVYRASAAAERRLGVPVNVTIVTAEEWASASSPFLRTVSRGPLVEVRVSEPVDR